MSKLDEIFVRFENAKLFMLGQPCQRFLCESYWYDDELMSSADLAFIQVKGAWLQLCVDYPSPYWRRFHQLPPAPYAVDRVRFEHIDIGLSADLNGQVFTSCNLIERSSSVSIDFTFANGRRVEIVGDDQTATVLHSLAL